MIDIFKLKVGDKVKYTGTTVFWFTDMIKNADTYLIKGYVYTVSYKQINSSCTYIKLKETDDLLYNLGWFDEV